MRVAFEPPPGLNSNETIYAAPGAWADGNNMRFHDGKAETIGGWQKVFADTLTGVCRNASTWTNIGGVQNIAFGTHSDLLVYVGGVLADITPVGLIEGSTDTTSPGPGYGTGPYGSGVYSIPPTVWQLRTWSLDTWGENLVAVPWGGTLYLWENDTGAKAAEVTNAPDQINVMLTTNERQVLALGCNEEGSSIFNPLCIRGCDIEDITDWTTAPDNNAFEHILHGTGYITAAKLIGPYVAVWTTNELHLGQYIGNPDQTYRFDQIDSNCGAIGANAVCILKGAAYWVGRDRQIRAWTPGARPTIIPCPIWKDFADNLDITQSPKLVASSNSRFDEVWFFYPDTRDGSSNSRYIAFSVTTGTWFRGQMARTAFCDAGVLSYPLGVTHDGAAYHHEIGSDADGEDLVWTIKSAAQYLNEAERVLQVQRVRPDFKDQENVISLTAYVRDHPQGTPRTKGPYTLPTTTVKKDLRFSGAIAELEFSGTGKARFGKPTFDAIPTGQR